MSRTIKFQLLAVFYVFSVLGVAALGTGIVLGIRTVTFLGKAQSTTGEVVELACQWQNPSTGVMHTFLSEDIWYDPGPTVDRQEIDVLIDPADPQRHHVDIAFLPERHD